MLAWAAGVFDGEGCITIHNSERDNRSLLIKVNMTDEDVVRRFHGVVGVGNTRGPYVAHRKKPMWVWQAGAFADVQAVVAMLWPWLCSRRRARSIELLRTYHERARTRRRCSKTGRIVPHPRKCGCDKGAGWMCEKARQNGQFC